MFQPPFKAAGFWWPKQHGHRAVATACKRFQERGGARRRVVRCVKDCTQNEGWRGRRRACVTRQKSCSRLPCRAARRGVLLHETHGLALAAGAGQVGQLERAATGQAGRCRRPSSRHAASRAGQCPARRSSTAVRRRLVETLNPSHARRAAGGTGAGRWRGRRRSRAPAPSNTFMRFRMGSGMAALVVRRWPPRSPGWRRWRLRRIRR